jgi:L-iditol 2-dehydrogenase
VDVILNATPEVRMDGVLLKMLVSGGRACVFSGPKAGDYETPIDIRSVHYRELSIVGSYGSTSRQNRDAAELLASGALDAGWVITARTALEKIDDAFSHVSERRGLKSVVLV